MDLGIRREDEIEYRGFLVDYEDSAEAEWGMAMRWAFSTARIFYDPEGRIQALIDEKVRLGEDERRWMIIEGMTQSEWHCNTCSEAWAYRGDMVSAHRSIGLALEYLLEALFGLNGRLLPHEKWLAYQARGLEWLPDGFEERLEEVLIVRDLSAGELRRRREALNHLWRQMLPRAEEEVGMKFSEFRRLV